MAETQETFTKMICTKVAEELSGCILCSKCLSVCPVFKHDFSVQDLNKSAQAETNIPDKIKDFTFSCVQCRRCVPACPEGLHRDEMMLVCKYKLRKEKPYGYKRYLAIRGPDLGPIAQTAQGLYVAMKMQKAPDLARHMETMPSSASVLFYPGCYIYSFETIRRTKHLLDHVGTPYVVLGGLTTCCGVPQLLQGEFDLADHCMEALHEKIQRCNPSVVLTGCAECLEALLWLKKRYHCTFEVYSVVEYLMQHVEKFPALKIRDAVTFHDSCRLTRRYKRDDATRKAISRFSTLVEMQNIRDQALCCYHWNQDYDPANTKNRMIRLNEAKQHAKTMVCDCLTCYEEFVKIKNDVEVIDILKLFEEALEKENQKKSS
ncbi:MAG: (Fe-S)-binding protein [Euryarchaeota archaeon]|nr:(Fe-S)-binding protein [Euryarchaeota archaeon]